MQLELALHSLHTTIDADELLFWGKINGINKDYFIAVAVTYSGQFEFPHKRFYWCLSDDYNFKETPDLNVAHKEFIDNDSLFFLGEPNKKLKQPAEGEEENAEPEPVEEEVADGDGAKSEKSDASDKPEVVAPTKDLVELDRVKYVVLAVENDCQIAPLGGFKMNSKHEVRRNEAFKGLNKDNCLNLDSYVHFRNV